MLTTLISDLMFDFYTIVMSVIVSIWIYQNISGFTIFGCFEGPLALILEIAERGHFINLWR